MLLFLCYFYHHNFCPINCLLQAKSCMHFINSCILKHTLVQPRFYEHQTQLTPAGTVPEQDSVHPAVGHRSNLVSLPVQFVFPSHVEFTPLIHSPKSFTVPSEKPICWQATLAESLVQSSPHTGNHEFYERG